MEDIKKVQNEILESAEFVLSETRKIQYTYGLKHETRYIVERDEKIKSESVAEHIYALHILAVYFLPLEDPEQILDWVKIHDLVQYHDIDEIETGDKIGYLKNDADKVLETEAALRVALKFPTHMKKKIGELMTEYQSQESKEAKFAKALDRIEPLFQLYNENGKKVLKLQQTTREESIRIKKPYVESYPILFRFFYVIQTTMEKEGYFH